MPRGCGCLGLGQGGLQEALDIASGTSFADALITFDPSLNGATIVVEDTLFHTTKRKNDQQGTIADGDIDGDGRADITLSGDVRQLPLNDASSTVTTKPPPSAAATLTPPSAAAEPEPLSETGENHIYKKGEGIVIHSSAFAVGRRSKFRAAARFCALRKVIILQN